jgi:membrane protease YdiL (CAAX protease family)
VHASIQLTLHRYRDRMPSPGRNTADGIDEALGAGLTPLLPEAVQRSFEEASIPPWEGFLASIGAGVNEEILFRLGLMTIFVFLGAQLLRQGDRPAAGVVWTAMVLATLSFGVVHLPQAAALGGGLPASLVASILLGNCLGGVVFGWLYWKRGLLAAVTAHFAPTSCYTL